MQVKIQMNNQELRFLFECAIKEGLRSFNYHSVSEWGRILKDVVSADAITIEVI